MLGNTGRGVRDNVKVGYHIINWLGFHVHHKTDCGVRDEWSQQCLVSWDGTHVPSSPRLAALKDRATR